MKTQKIIFLVLFSCFSVLLQSTLFAQENDRSTFESDFRTGLSFNYSPNSFRGWGTIQNSEMAFINGQFWHTSINLKSITARFGSEIIFTHWIRYPQDGIDGPRDQRVGFGIVPVHFTVPFTNNSFTPFYSASVGLLFLNDRLPAIDGATLNYKLSSGLGIEIPVDSDTKFQLGYRLQHISNGNSSVENPGIDSHVFFANLIFAKW